MSVPTSCALIWLQPSSIQLGRWSPVLDFCPGFLWITYVGGQTGLAPVLWEIPQNTEYVSDIWPADFSNLGSHSEQRTGTSWNVLLSNLGPGNLPTAKRRGYSNISNAIHVVLCHLTHKCLLPERWKNSEQAGFHFQRDPHTTHTNQASTICDSFGSSKEGF